MTNANTASSPDLSREFLSGQSEDIVSAVLSSLPALISVLDCDGTIVYVNRAWLQSGIDHGVHDISRISPGVNYLEVCQQGIEANLAEARLIRDAVLAVLNGSEKLFEMKYRCARGGYCAWFCVTVTPLQLRNLGAVICHTNITSYIEGVRQDKNREQDYSALIENSLDIIKILDSHGKVLYVNRALESVLGYAPENLGLRRNLWVTCGHRTDHGPTDGVGRVLRSITDRIANEPSERAFDRGSDATTEEKHGGR